jgi:hypothetical protein
VIIYGWRKRVKQLATATYLCGQCGNPTAHALRRAVTQVTLFFIPLFPISAKYFTVCTFCGATNKLTKAEAQQVMATPAGPVPGPPAPPYHPGTPPQGFPPQAGQPAAYPRPGYPPQSLGR